MHQLLSRYIFQFSARLLTLLIAVFAIYSGSDAQGQGAALTGASEFDKTLQSAAQASAADIGKDQTPADGVISPEYYRIGPGDALSFHVLPLPGIEQIIIVSADNSIILPRFGSVSLAGKTLAQTKDTIAKIYALRNPNALVSISLRRARTVYCSVRGNVAFPGVKTYPASARISSIVALANQPPAAANSKPASAKNADDASTANVSIAGLSSYAARNITVLHSDGTAENADIIRAKYGASPESDPTVREGDEIIVPFEPETFSSISIGGAINRPASLAFKNGDKLSMLLRAGYGLRDDADLSKITLTLPDGSKQKVAIQHNGELDGADAMLQAGSALTVGYIPRTENTMQGLAEITGEAVNPGTYPIINNQTRIKDLMEQAGGFTQNAYLPLAYVVRREKNKPNVEVEKPGWAQIQYTDLTFEDTTRLLIHTALKRPVVSMDFVKAFRDNSAADNITLADGDIIVIPANPRRVYVYGQVNQPGYVEFTPGKRLNWYVERAGGYAAGAEQGLARIIKGKNKVWVEDNDTVYVEAGDEVYAPPPPYTPPGYNLQLYTFIGTILTTVAFLTSTLVGLLKK